MKKMYIGLFVLLAKIGPKFLAIFTKLLKSVKVTKVGLAGASAATYAHLFTWEFALLIMVMLFVHESGHVWAMKRCGVKTKGFYFIPFFGGAAVAESAFPSRAAEVHIAIMGPIFGLAFSALIGVLYYFTGNPIFAAGASWGALINLFNLLPINPLDGGRIWKSVAFSVHSGLGLAFLLFGMLLGALGSVFLGLSLLAFMAIIGGFELLTEWHGYKRNGLRIPIMGPAGLLSSMVLYIGVGLALWGVMWTMQAQPGCDLAMQMLQG